MKIKQGDFLILKNKNDQDYKVYLKSKKIGKMKITFKNQNYVVTTSMYKNYFSYESLYKKMMLHYLFSRYKVKQIYDGKTPILFDDFYFIKKYKTLLFDIDDTILSFQNAEKKALSLALNKCHIHANEKILKKYHEINIKYWKMVEKNIISRDECLIKRFEEFLPLIHLNYDASEFENLYRHYLNQQAYIVKDARLVLKTLTKTHRIYAITNGVKDTQQYRIKKANLKSYFLEFFVSSDIGYHKPSLLYFECVKNKIPNFDAKSTLIIGDSLSSDIQLGLNAHIDTCWFNFEFLPLNDSIQATYVIHSLKELIY